MILIGDKVVADVSSILGLAPTSSAVGIGFLGAGGLVAGVVYDKWSGAAMEAHVWTHEGHIPPVQWAAAVIDYPFNQLNLDMIVAWVGEYNSKALWLCQKLGFKDEGYVSEFFLDGSGCHILRLLKEDCELLKSERWMNKVPRNEDSRVRTETST